VGCGTQGAPRIEFTARGTRLGDLLEDLAASLVSCKKMPVSERAAVQRINRALKHNDQILKKGRGRIRGQYYLVDFKHNWVVHENVGIPALAGELGVLGKWEEVVFDD
jgi:hypothetical protein